MKWLCPCTLCKLFGGLVGLDASCACRKTLSRMPPNEKKGGKKSAREALTLARDTFEMFGCA